jgi:hypothetical protein
VQDNLNTHRLANLYLVYAACLKELKGLIRACAEWFSKGIYAITGNHDERLAKKTGGQVTIQMMMEGKPVNFSIPVGLGFGWEFLGADYSTCNPRFLSH